MSIGKMTSVSVTGNASPLIGWDDGRIANVDFASTFARRPALAILSDPRVFAQVTLSADGWSLEWLSGIDFGAAQLRRWADDQSGNVMPATDFPDWVRTRGLSSEHAADALGLPIGRPRFT